MGDGLSTFLNSGIYQFENSNAVFIDPVRVMNRSYTHFRVSPSAYYPRFFESKPLAQESRVSSSNSRKRKRKEKKPHSLNDREKAAEQRHQVSIDSCCLVLVEVLEGKFDCNCYCECGYFFLMNSEYGLVETRFSSLETLSMLKMRNCMPYFVYV